MWKNLDKSNPFKRAKLVASAGSLSTSLSSDQQRTDSALVEASGSTASTAAIVAAPPHGSPWNDPSAESGEPSAATAPVAVYAANSPNIDHIGKENKDNYGIKVLYSSASAIIDIVFIHGLTGSAYTTWLHKESGVHWPRDLLKNDLKDAQIMTFGYDVDVVNFWKHAAQDGISGYANDLLGCLAGYREGISDSRRIIFVVHSLGGLVTQRALNISRESRFPHLRHIETCTVGICFLGTPHHGADLAKWGTILTDVVNIAKPANRNVVKLLERDSEMLAEVQDAFHNVLEKRKEEGLKIEITCFYELLPVIRSCIVPKESATMSGELNYPIHSNHMDMTKFSNPGDKGYQDILREIRRLAKALSPAGIDLVANEDDKKCLRDLRMTDPRDDKVRIEESKDPLLTGSCEWVLHDPDFVRWSDGSDSRLLWINGDPGKGKTMMLIALVAELSSRLKAKPGSGVLSYFFCQSTDPRLNNAVSVLRGLIYLLVVEQRTLIRHLRKEYDHQGKQLFDGPNAFYALRRVL